MIIPEALIFIKKDLIVDDFRLTSMTETRKFVA
jgi:hypothetical protein